ncbi:hypothetical protein CEP51_016472 [Fusarium floridanum]|uniref:CRAL-TRIO domain-containing protein n=1 Tax=Fusarium floridanum TaxID=1325733 RepID=A0A428NNY7_9HYPO|nr:hypothetical protein CEP51_016472 [Fusarium floridanum]
MADPLTALGTASAIITFLEFSWKLLANTRAVYQSATGLYASKNGENDENMLLALVAKDVKTLGDAVIASPAAGNDMEDLVRTSQGIAEDLLKALDKLKVKGDKTVWKSVTVALKDVWGKSKVEDFSRRLAKLQVQVASHIQLSLLNGVSDVSRALRDLEDTHQKLRFDTRTELQALRDDILSATAKVVPDESESESCVKRQLKISKNDEVFGQPLVGTFATSLHDFSGSMTQLLDVGRSTAVLHGVMKSLHFTSLKTRQSKISEAHAATFAWIFHGSLRDSTHQVTFVDFLEGRGELFWVQGKPGSGKSTLMKFLSSHLDTYSHLRRWAGSRKLLVASCFFWYAGSRLQKSQEGLFRSLLFEMLRQCPEIAPQVYHLRAELEGYDGHDWSWTCADLLYTCRKLIEHFADIAFCFFIDGLDEYDEHGMAPVDLIETLGQFASFPNVRLCVSSRPWPVFTDAFNKYPNLRLEDLTRKDILNYVTDHFDKSVPFQRAKDTDPSYPALPKRICSQAQGVFLWVYLVVRDLLDGLTHGETLQTLLGRLEAFPKDLTEFFQHMIDTIQPVYLQQTARTLDVTMSTQQALPMIVYSFLDEVESDPSFALQENCGPMPVAQVVLREDLVRRRLSGRCKGLLEITADEDMPSGYFNLKVDVIHRTVFEFLQTSASVQSLVKAHAVDPSTPLLLCRALIAAINRAPLITGTTLISELFENLLSYAAEAEQNTTHRDEVVRLLDCAQDTFHRGNATWKWGMVDSYFLGLACRMGVSCYADVGLSKAQAQHWINGSEKPLLDYVLTDRAGIQVDIIGTLLRAGADPNARIRGSTVWGYFMGLVDREESFRDQPGILDAIKLLIANGADLEAQATSPFVSWPPEGPGDGEGGIRRAPALRNMGGLNLATRVAQRKASDVIKDHFAEEEETWKISCWRSDSRKEGPDKFMFSTLFYISSIETALFLEALHGSYDAFRLEVE